MKNVKILYILIGALCFIAIIVGIYAQFLAKEDTILPPLNQNSKEEIQKTAEEIKAQFTNLFTNVLNGGDYDTSNINKIAPDKDIVYSAYDINEKKENYEINVHLPVINIKGDVPTSFNNITQTIFANKAADILNNKSNSKVIYQINYVAYINGDILSLIIEGTLKEENKPQRLIVQTYNYNMKTEKKEEIIDVLSQKNLIQSEVQNKINDTITKEKEKAEVLVQSGYTVYNRNLDNNMYKLENISHYFLGPNGDLYIIFAYGNNDYTSEMDIVLFENENSSNAQPSDNSTNYEQ